MALCDCRTLHQHQGTQRVFDVCPVDCIHPAQGRGRPTRAKRCCYINPVECIDCGALRPGVPGDRDFRVWKDLSRRKWAAVHGDERRLVRQGR